MKKDIPAGTGLVGYVTKGLSPARRRHRGRQGDLANPLPRLLLGPSQRSLQPHGEDEYMDGLSGAPCSLS